MSTSSKITTNIKVLAITALIATSATSTTLLMTADSAFAGNNGGNGNGNGGGNGKSGGNKADKDSKKQSVKSKSSNAKTKSGEGKIGKKLKSLFKKDKEVAKAKATVAKPQKKTAALDVTVEPLAKEKKKEHKNINAALGALNAAHASPNALLNASPNSRVGKIAAYRDSVLEAQTLETNLDEATAILDGMDVPERTAEEIAFAGEELAGDKATLEAEIATLEDQLEASGGVDADISAQLDDANSRLSKTDEDIAALEAEAENGAAYADAEQDVIDAETNLAEQEDISLALLEDAGNKPITPEVIEEVNRLLGLNVEEDDVEEDDVAVDEDDVVDDDVVVLIDVISE